MNILNEDELRTAKEYYVNKLVSSWIKHHRLIIYVDYDQTILGYEPFEYKLCDSVIYTIKEAQHLGAIVVLYTCRDSERLDKALEYCKNIGLSFDNVNPSKPFKEDFSSKPYYNILLDDKAGLPYSLEILQEAIEKYRRYLGIDPTYGVLT